MNLWGVKELGGGGRGGRRGGMVSDVGSGRVHSVGTVDGRGIGICVHVLQGDLGGVAERNRGGLVGQLTKGLVGRLSGMRS